MIQKNKYMNHEHNQRDEKNNSSVEQKPGEDRKDDKKDSDKK